MSANVYRIEDLLVGKHYRSNSVEGEIVFAEKHPKGVWYGSNTESYLVTVRPKNSINDVMRSLAVIVSED